jgi:hypothetical protein
MDFGVDIWIFYILFGLQNILVGVDGIVKVKEMPRNEVIAHYILLKDEVM